MAESPTPQSDNRRASPNSQARRRRRIAFGTITVLASVLAAASLSEVGLRLFCRRLDPDEKSLLYRYDSRLGWFPKPDSQGTFTASRTIHIRHNQDGFRGPEFSQGRKPAMVFLGDSFVWGFDVEASERFTEKLQAKHSEWAIYNLGVSGYGTDQEYLLLDQYFSKYRPRVVFLVYCVENDDSDNCANFRFGYYKPYCTVSGTHLELKGIPVPRSARVFWVEHPAVCRSYLARLLIAAYYALSGPAHLHNPNPSGPLLRDLQKYVHRQGAELAVGVTRDYYYLEEFLAAFHIPWVDLSTDQRYPGFGRHWTPAGHAIVADKIEGLLQRAGLLEKAAGAASP